MANIEDVHDEEQFPVTAIVRAELIIEFLTRLDQDETVAKVLASSGALAPDEVEEILMRLIYTSYRLYKHRKDEIVGEVAS